MNISKFVKKILATTLLVSTTMLISGCEGMNKQGGGTLIGGATGALLGSTLGKGEGKLIATGIGAVAGAFIGNRIGKSLDDHDKALLAQSSQKALELAPTGNAVAWNNPDSGNRGTVTPIKTFERGNTYCREYVQEVVIGGEKQKAYGTACRKPDGQWEIQQ